MTNSILARLEFCKKLGLMEGHTIALLGAPAFIQRMAKAMFPLDNLTILPELTDGATPNIVVYWPSESDDLTASFQRLRERLAEDGAVWAVIPIKSVADARGPRVYRDQVVAAARPAGLVDSTTVSFSQEEFGIRLTVRREVPKAKAW